MPYIDKRALSELLLEVQRGNVSGYSTIHKFGRNPSVGTSLVPICDGGFYRTPTSTVTLECVSDDSNDTSAGTGLQEITLVYLDSTFTQQTATMQTNGVTASTEKVAGVLRLLRAYGSRSGTYATQTSSSQKGTITIRENGGGNTWATIPEVGTTGFAVGQSLIGAYTVPAAKTAYILSTTLTVDSTKSANLYFFQRQNADDVTTPYSGIMRIQNIYTGVSDVHEITHKTYETYPEKTDMGFLGVVSANTADVSVEFELLLIDN